MEQQTYNYIQTGGTARATLQWVAKENIADFEQQLKLKTDTCQRKFLQGLLVPKREKPETPIVSER